MEKWDILDAEGQPIGKTAVRGKTTLSSGEYHLVVHIWVVSDDGKFLIQRRSKLKKLMPGEWAATGGAAISGEDSFTAAKRELEEELGLVSDENSLKFIKRVKRRSAFVDIWKIKCNIPAEEFKLQESEVDRVKWVTKQQLKDMISNGKFHNYGKYYWSVIFGTNKELEYEFEY